MRERTTIVFIHRADGPVPAGRLRVVEGGRNSYAAFAYGSRYLTRRDAIPVDPEALPLKGGSTEVLTEEGFELFNGIRDAAPDGWGRYLMQKAAGAQTLTEFDYLVASGSHRIGALAFGPTPASPERLMPWVGVGGVEGDAFDLDELVAAAQINDIDRLDPKFKRLLEAGSSLGGARPKAVAASEGSEWIAKFPARNDSFDEPLAEFVAMSLARDCGLHVPKVELRSVAGKNVYLVERFDRVAATAGALAPVPFSSGLTILHAHEIAAGEYSYSDLAGAIRRHGSAPAEDLRELYGRLVFNILCGNTDDHLRNHGFLHDGTEWRLSPLYDVVPKPQVGSERHLVLGVGDDGKQATLRNALSSHSAFGLSSQDAAALVETLRRCVAANWEQHFIGCGASQSTIERLAPCFAESRNDDWQVDEETGWLPR